MTDTPARRELAIELGVKMAAELWIDAARDGVKHVVGLTNGVFEHGMLTWTSEFMRVFSEEFRPIVEQVSSGAFEQELARISAIQPGDELMPEDEARTYVIGGSIRAVAVLSRDYDLSVHERWLVITSAAAAALVVSAKDQDPNALAQRYLRMLIEMLRDAMNDLAA